MSGQGIFGSARAAHLWYKVAQTGEGPLHQRWRVALEPQAEEHSQESYVSRARKGDRMQVPIEPLFTLIMGILILLVPRLLNYFVAIYLIIIGLLGLLNKVHL